jgi:gluconolactonase
MVPDGMAVDSIGRLYVAVTRDDAVEVLTPEGVSVGRVELPEGSFASNCCFGGDDLRTLYVTAARHGSVLEFAVDTPGLALNDQMRKT